MLFICRTVRGLFVVGTGGLNAHQLFLLGIQKHLNYAVEK